ncbi:MAG: type IV pilus secretin PilQ [Thermodesulfobacteriota bacterium]
MIWAGRSLAAIILIGLAVGLIACGTSDMATRPTTASGDSGAVSDGRPALTGLKVEAAGRQTRVILQGNQPLTYTALLEDRPPAIMVDAGGTPSPNVTGQTSVKNGLVDKIEVEPLAGTSYASRVKILLTMPTTYQVIREGANLVVLVENVPGAVASAIRDDDLEDVPVTAAQMAGGTANVTSVDFKSVGTSGRTRLLIKTDRVVTPQIMARDRGLTLVLSMSPADIPRHLIRSLDTTFYRCPVNYVKPTVTSNVSVEFIIKLREVVPYHLGQKGLITYVDFDPSGMRARPGRVEPYRLEAPAADTAAARTAASAAPKAAPAAAPKAETKIVTSPGQPKQYTGQKISLDFQNADIHNILRLIGEVSGKNVVVSDKVTGKVTLKLSEVPWDQALDIVLAANQLGMVEVGNVIRIDKADVLRAQRELEVKDLEQTVEQVKKAPLEKRVFTPKYAAVSTMKTELEKLKTERGKLTIIGNDIYVEEEPHTLAVMQEVFSKNDQVARQVLIESRIVEALSSFTKQLGVNWGGDYSAPSNEVGRSLTGTLGMYGVHSGGTMGAGGAAVNLISPPATGLALGFGLVSSRLNLDAKLYAMEKTGEGRIVSAPRILASNDQEVYIKQGQSIPYESSGTTTSPSTITYNEAVLNLKVKPHIEENGKIISMDITVTKDTADYSRTTRNPPINKREAKTKLMVKNGETVVIGGIIIDEKSKTVNRVPGLHKIPVLGWLFKDYEISDAKTELLIFLTSNIIPVSI